MKTFRLFLGDVGDNPKMAAGVLFYAPDTKKYGVALRSKECDCPHTHGPVGGSAKGDETPEQACTRETKEEIGYKIDPKKLQHLDSSKKGNFTYHTYFYPLKKQDDMADIKLNDENDDFVWFDLKNPPKPLHPGFKNTLNKTYEKLKGITND